MVLIFLRSKIGQKRKLFERLFNQDVVQERRVRQRGRTDAACGMKATRVSALPTTNSLWLGLRRGPHYWEGGMLYII